ncbi:hypothetical protein EOS_33115 [Caballeronia mineralivorans PML1(12)]|uniref:Polysaccharide biosynthesis protein GumN n=2 Tax=Caballeronia mineralivorans TaxID=2010198 RepID=A0A0J1FQF4_9BURK|nr:hypothetical protein EOS_33115 [Caballeronia mineralivorans PML1(12)]
MLWRLQGSNTYVLGSIHATDMNPIQLLPAEYTAFANAARVIFELDSTEALDPTPIQLPTGTPPPHDRIPADTLANVQAHVTRLGLDARCLHTTKPGWVALQLMVHAAAAAGYHGHLGVDEQLRSQAKREAKQVDKLESRADQMHILSSAPMDEQIAFLSHVAQSDAGLSEFRQMLDAWKSRDYSYFEALLAKRIELIPHTMSELVWRRNTNWIPKILDQARRQESALFVVGVLHLCGPVGLPYLLAQQGHSLLRCT